MSNRSCFRVLPAAVVVAVCLCMVTSAAAQQRIGVFDAGRVSEETDEGRLVQSRLEAFRSTKQAEITAKEQELTSLQSQLNTQALSLSPERRSDLEKQIQRKALEMIAGGSVPADMLITHYLPVEKVLDGIKLMKEGVTLKVCIQMKNGEQ